MPKKPHPTTDRDAMRFLDRAERAAGPKQQHHLLLLAGITRRLAVINRLNGAVVSPGRPETRSKADAFTTAVTWCVEEAERTGCAEPWRLAKRAHIAGTLPPIPKDTKDAEAATRRAIDRVARRVKVELTKKTPKQ